MDPYHICTLGFAQGKLLCNLTIIKHRFEEPVKTKAGSVWLMANHNSVSPLWLSTICSLRSCHGCDRSFALGNEQMNWNQQLKILMMVEMYEEHSFLEAYHNGASFVYHTICHSFSFSWFLRLRKISFDLGDQDNHNQLHSSRNLENMPLNPLKGEKGSLLQKPREYNGHSERDVTYSWNHFLAITQARR